YASVYPLVTARALAREFTYEVSDEVRPGAVVEVRFGNAKRRGVVTEVDVAPPDGIDTSPVERVVAELPRPLVERALWLAEACAAALERGRGAIVLVPEIALTPQTLGRFRARFGDRIAVLHSGLTEAERRDERLRIARGEAPIVVGARSAVFASVPRLGVICVDEEHDASYKQESDPRYDARTVAAKRAALENAVAVFGSATPRPESWGKLERLDLGGRLSGPLPPVRVA